MSAELLPCPFCGGEGRVHPMGPGAEGFFAASCTSPGCFVLNADFWGEVVATEAWNRRAPLSARPDESPSVSQDEQTASLLSRLKEAERDLGWLYISDDGPEWSASHPVESGEVPDARNIRPANATALLEQLKDAWGAYQEGLQSEARAHRTAGEDRAALQAAQARIKVLEGALETFAILANEETDYLPDEHLISLTYDDSDLDDDLGGPNTLLGERFMRAFRRARAALLPQLGGENG